MVIQGGNDHARHRAVSISVGLEVAVDCACTAEFRTFLDGSPDFTFNEMWAAAGFKDTELGVLMKPVRAQWLYSGVRRSQREAHPNRSYRWEIGGGTASARLSSIHSPRTATSQLPTDH